MNASLRLFFNARFAFIPRTFQCPSARSAFHYQNARPAISLDMHISYHIIAFILYKMLLMLIFLCVPKSMVWNEDEDQNPIYLVIFTLNIAIDFGKPICQLWEQILMKRHKVQEVVCSRRLHTLARHARSQKGHVNVTKVAFLWPYGGATYRASMHDPVYLPWCPLLPINTTGWPDF